MLSTLLHTRRRSANWANAAGIHSTTYSIGISSVPTLKGIVYTTVVEQQTAVLGTEAHFGIGRSSSNRPKNVFGFRFFEGNNRNRNRELSGQLFGGLLNLNVFLAPSSHPHEKKRTPRSIFECASVGT